MRMNTQAMTGSKLRLKTIGQIHLLTMWKHQMKSVRLLSGLMLLLGRKKSIKAIRILMKKRM